MTEQRIAELEAKGFKRWIKGTYDRLYINASVLGLVCDYYKTGNISYAEFNGEKISNAEAYRMKSAKTFVDVKTGTIYSNNKYLKETAEVLLKGKED